MFKTMILPFLFILIIFTNLISSDWELYNMDNSGINSNSILVIKSMSPNKIWYGSYDNGISIFDGDTWTSLDSQNSSLPSNKVKAIAIDNSGLIWIGTENGLVSYNGSNMEVFTSSNSNLLSNDIMSLTIDEEGDLWIGTWGGGITVKSNQDWTNFNSENSQLLCDYIEDISVGLNNIKVISVCHTFGGVGGIYIYDDVDWHVYNSSNSSIMRDWNHSALIDANENLWIASEGAGVIFYNGTNWKNYTSSSSNFPSIVATDMVIDHNGDIWASSADGGVALFNENDWIPFNEQNSELHGYTINDIEIDVNGNRWFASWGDGVSKLSASAVVGIIQNEEFKANNFAVYQNYPNPFNPSTKISFQLPSSENVVIEVFNALGQKIETLLSKQLKAGNHKVEFNSADYPSGVYFYRVVAGNFQDYKKMILLK